MFPRFPFFHIFIIVILPQVLQAQTSGTSAPEVAQFEPVDTTDLVNLATGDFSYAIPAMVIPGAPGGAYPLSLNYHAGILHGQEASWVGLGWNLSPGAVTRLLRGYPDDWKEAVIHRYEQHKSIYSYSIGFGYKGVTAGVRFNNHEGFSGVYLGTQASQFKVGVRVDVGRNGVGFSLNDTLSKGVGGSIGYHSKGGFSGGLNVGVGRGVQVGASFSRGSGIGGNLFVPTGSGQGISLDSSGGVGFSSAADGITRSFSSGAASETIQTGGGNVRTSSLSLDIPLGVTTLSLGYHKSTFSRTQQNLAFGYIHLPEVRHLDQVTLGNDELDILYAKNGEEHFTALDFYTQDYQEGMHRNLLGEKYGRQSTLDTDYQMAHYDLFSVAAQGIHGQARPILGHRGWIRPVDGITALEVDTENLPFRVHPYREILQRIRGVNDDPVAWPEYRGLFAGDGWDYATEGWLKTAPGAKDNMTFTDDNGYVEDTRFYPWQGTQGQPFFSHRPQLKNRSRRVYYQLDISDTYIERIVVVKPDGLRYVFGHIQTSNGRQVVGAAPRILSETTHSRVTDQLDASGSQLKAITTKADPYAYAWYLAAVESPDYVDRGPEGYDPEDLGLYITFEYARITHQYHFATPWPSDEDNPDYMLTGMKRDQDQYYFERAGGTKELWVPHKASTKTHVALFELGMAPDDHRSDARPLTPSHEIEFENAPNLGTNPNEETLTAFAKHSRDFYYASQVDSEMAGPLAGMLGVDTDQVLFFPSGMGLRTALNTPFAADLVCGTTSLSETLTFKGSLASGWDVFTLSTSTPCAPSSLLRIRVANNLNGTVWMNNHSVKLNRIKLYERDAFFEKAKIPDHQTVTLYHWKSMAQDNDYQSMVALEYDPNDPLGNKIPNSDSGGRLTLRGVSFYGRGGISGNPGYRFDYFVDPDAEYGTYERRDPWGFYSKIGNVTFRKTDPRLLYDPDHHPFPTQALYSLKQVDTPVGTRIGIEYESDRYAWVQDRLALDFDRVSLTDVPMWEEDNDWVWGLGEALDQIGSPDGDQMLEAFHQHNTTQLTLPIPGDVDLTQARLVATQLIQTNRTLTYQFRVGIDEATADFTSSPGLREFLFWLYSIRNGLTQTPVSLTLKPIPAVPQETDLMSDTEFKHRSPGNL